MTNVSYFINAISKGGWDEWTRWKSTRKKSQPFPHPYYNMVVFVFPPVLVHFHYRRSFHFTSSNSHQFTLVTRRPYCPGRPKGLCFTTLSLAMETMGMRLSVVKQSFFGSLGRYSHLVTRVNTARLLVISDCTHSTVLPLHSYVHTIKVLQ